jgi:hypothetical protein
MNEREIEALLNLPATTPGNTFAVDDGTFQLPNGPETVEPEAEYTTPKDQSKMFANYRFAPKRYCY